jgi:hypothetical protein
MQRKHHARAALASIRANLERLESEAARKAAADRLAASDNEYEPAGAPRIIFNG